MLQEVKNIYILLTDTGTLFSRAIKMFTKAPLNHASIAFDSELTELYSFGRKNPNNPIIGGFVKESVYGSLIRCDRSVTRCALYKITVDAQVYERIRRYIRNFEENQELYRYNLLGLFGILMKCKIERKHAYFCSQFVASVFHENGVPLVNKHPAFVTPADLETSASLQQIYRGDLRSYVMQHSGRPYTFARAPRELENVGRFVS